MRRVALWIVLLVELGALGWLIARESDPAIVAHDDFISSWAAGRLNAFGRDPYNASLVLALQRTVGWTESIPYRIWYPPWAMALLAPFGVLPYQTGRIVWWVFNIYVWVPLGFLACYWLAVRRGVVDWPAALSAR